MNNIEFSNVTLEYPGSRDRAITDATFALERGELALIGGASGAGKSTLLRAITMEILPTSGSVSVGAWKITSHAPERLAQKIRRSIGVVFQDFQLLEDRNVFENVAFPLYVTGTVRDGVATRVANALAEVGLTGQRMSFPRELSGGQAQRAAIARAIIGDPLVLLADEPTANVDDETAADIYSLLARINARGITTIIATHDRHATDILRPLAHKKLRRFDVTSGTVTEL